MTNRRKSIVRVRDNALAPYLRAGELAEVDHGARPMECDVVVARLHDGSAGLFEYRDVPDGLAIVGVVTGLHAAQ